MNFSPLLRNFPRAVSNLICGLGLSSMLLLTGCGGASQGASAAPVGGGRGGGGAAVVVETASVVSKPMAIKVRAVGNVEASSSVDVRAQVSGELLSVEFTEGQDVRAGQLLFTVDPAPFASALKQAEAALARDTAQAKNLEAQRTRAESLLKAGLVARADYDALVALVGRDSGLARVGCRGHRECADSAQRTRIVAPVAGRTGALLVHRGLARAEHRFGGARRDQPADAGVRELRRAGPPVAAVTWRWRGPAAAGRRGTRWRQPTRRSPARSASSTTPSTRPLIRFGSRRRSRTAIGVSGRARSST